MRSSHRFWLALSLLLVAGAIVIWFKGQPAQHPAAPVAWSQPPRPAAPQMPALLTTPSVIAASGNAAKKPESAAALRGRYQLSNVEQPIEALTRVGSAILMKNALIDTKQPVQLPIPADLRAGENPGAYIVQADRATSDAFQKMLKDAGAEIVAYVPNNAFLVKANHEVASNLEQQQGVQSVLPYEPYYKLDTRLMKFAVDHETMADDAWLRVTLFPGASANSLAALANAVGPTENSPFGQQVLIQPQTGTLASIAQLPEVQIVEPVNPRIPANDMTRVTLGVSQDTLTNANHLGLSGQDVWVNVNDIGVQSNHPALAGRVFYQGNNAKADFDGHGTHVAATIAGGRATAIFDNMAAIGTNSLRTNVVVTTDEDGNSTTNFFIDRSRTNADFRGIAHNAKLFVLPIDFNPDVNTPVTDSYLIETAAATNYFTLKRTNETLISNNSWNYANTPDYDSQAARYDAATRDALPDNTGSQPVTYVFAAGNLGFGGEDGLGGEPGSIASPGTAKNVITVGALEAPRFIAEALTNVEERVEIDDQGQPQTNKVTNLVQVFRPITDSANEVASFSSRGNVGIGVEGAQGRFKPDLVAPGVFIMSARSTNWNLTNDFSPFDTNTLPMFNLLSNLDSVSTLYRYDSGTSFSAPGVSGLLALVQEFFSHKLQPPKRRNLSPAMMKALLLTAARSVNALYDWDPRGRVNYQGWGLVDLRNLLTTTLEETNQPSRSTLEAMDESQWPIQLIDQSPTNAIATGEELVWNITVDTNALAAPLRFTLVWTDPPGNPAVGVKLVNDLDLTVEAGNRVFHGNDFVSGSLETEARPPLVGTNTLPIDDPYRDTINNVEKIVIGDPEGLGTNVIKVKISGRRVNVKAVNDYYDVTHRTNEIVQDFALVISADNSFVTNAFPKIERVANVTVDTNIVVQPIYNGLQATNQRAGANSPLYWTNGNASQWRFYVFTNSDAALKAGYGVTLTAGVNVAFITSSALNIGSPRNIEPDIDLYVSKDPKLLSLDSNAISDAWKSTTSFGTEQVVFAPEMYVRDANGNLTYSTNLDGTVVTNTVQVYDPSHPEQGGVVVGRVAIGDVFYVGVKSEDQQAGEFTLIAVSTDRPFEEDRDGIRIIHLLPAPAPIPDGLPNLPQGARYYGVPLRGGRILDASVYVAVQHEELGDLVGTVGHGARYATLNNHSLPDGFTNLLALVYSDYPYAISPQQLNSEYPPGLYTPPFPAPGRPQILKPDGPLMLSTYTGQKAQAVWTLDMVDNTASHTGLVYQAEVHVKPLPPFLPIGQTIKGTVDPFGQDFYAVDVPNDASKMTITLTLPGGANPDVELLVRKDIIPSTNEFDYIGTFTNGNNTVTITVDRNSQPPLLPGIYILGIVNSGSSAVDYELTVTMDRAQDGAFENAVGDPNVSLKDDARTNSVQELLADRVVTRASVKILAQTDRVSDLVLRLVSPQGTKVLLAENRGWTNSDGFGLEGPTVKNGGFELPDLPRATLANTPPTNWTGSGVTLIHGNYSQEYPLPYEGQQYCRLDPAATLSQTIGVFEKRAYFLEWFDSSRTNGPNQSSPYAVVVTDSAGALIFTNNFDAKVDIVGNWARKTAILDFNPGTYTITFVGRPGNPEQALIDNVSLSGGSYVIFTDDLGDAVKFAPLPLSDQSSFRGLAFSNSFEGAATGTYAASSTFDGWTVDSNSVTVASGGAADAAQYLRTGNGVISRTLPTSPGQSYRLSFAYRAQSQPIGTFNVNYRFNAGGGPPTVAGDFSNANDGNPYDATYKTVPGPYFIDAAPGVYQAKFSANPCSIWTSGQRLTNVVAPTTRFVHSSGQIVLYYWDWFAADNSSTQFTIVDLSKITQAATTVRLIGGQTNTVSIFAEGDWQIFNTEFVADQTNMVLQFDQTGSSPGADLDLVQLEETGTKFLKPEEPLALLQGERAMGDWTLQAVDTRTGASLPSDFLYWQVLLDVAMPARLAEPLASGITYPTTKTNNPVIRAHPELYTPGRLLGGETEWFYFDVCPDATFATVRLFAPNTNSVPIELLVDRSGFPTGDPERDDYAIIRTTPGVNSTVSLPLSLTSPAAAPLQPGKRIFIAVRAGEFPPDTNQTFRINIQPNGCTFTPPTVLTPAQPLSTVAFAPAPGDEGSTYQSTTAGPSTVTITADGSLTILASNGTEPTESNYQLKQTVSSGSATLALPSAGTWFFRVINNTSDTVSYTLTVGAGQSSTIRDVSVANNHLTVTWASVVGTSYEIATSTDLVNWTPVTTIQATSTETTYTDNTAATGTMRFIRIRPL